MTDLKFIAGIFLLTLSPLWIGLALSAIDHSGPQTCERFHDISIMGRYGEYEHCKGRFNTWRNERFIRYLD
jgi:hypothetical protein